ncbi:hypothetical protein GCM10018987_16220 [Streptomyces cremeus]
MTSSSFEARRLPDAAVVARLLFPAVVARTTRVTRKGADGSVHRQRDAAGRRWTSRLEVPWLPKGPTHSLHRDRPSLRPGPALSGHAFPSHVITPSEPVRTDTTSTAGLSGTFSDGGKQHLIGTDQHRVRPPELAHRDARRVTVTCTAPKAQASEVTEGVLAEMGLRQDALLAPRIRDH